MVPLSRSQNNTTTTTKKRKKYQCHKDWLAMSVAEQNDKLQHQTQRAGTTQSFTKFNKKLDYLFARASLVINYYVLNIRCQIK